MRARRRLVVIAMGVALAASALFAGCSKQSTPMAPPLETPPAIPPSIKAVYPAARSTGVIYDTPIWVDLGSPLVPASITETNVYLKLDTQRLPVTLGYDAASGRLSLAPRVRLELRRTYTVEITPRLLAVGGGPVAPAGWFWQFTTNSLRHLDHPVPVTGAAFESPFVRLEWDSTETTAGKIDYEIFVDPDSAAVAGRALASLTHASSSNWIPRRRWVLGTALYWSIRARNQATGELADGPVWRFETLPASTPVDTVVAAADQWGYVSVTSNSHGCMGSTTVSGPNYRCGIHWVPPAGGDAVRFAGAEFIMTISPDFDPVLQLALSGAVAPWQACSGLNGGPPPRDFSTPLAVATAGQFPNLFRMSSDFMTAYLEAEARDGDVLGYAISSASNVGHVTSDPHDIRHGGLRVFLYRVPPRPPAAGKR